MGKEKKALVLGVGNILLKDEGLGVRSVEYLKNNFVLPPGVDCVDGGTSGISLLSIIKEYPRLVIVDAVVSSAPAGSIILIDARKIKQGPPLRTSVHQIGMAEVLELARFEGLKFEAVIVGVVPEDLSAGLELSDTIKDRLPAIAEAVIEALRKLGLKAGQG